MKKDITLKTLLSSDLIIKSPGISDDSLIVKQIKDKGVPIISEIEYGFENTDSKNYCCNRY